MKTPVKEEQVQRCILEGLTAYGYIVKQTTVRGVRKGYGASPGVPDLLVTHPKWPEGCWLGLEVKGPKTALSQEQRVLEALHRIVVVRSWEDALSAVESFRTALGVLV